jgi:IclR family transcriptional regulator, pca regulon regulatory protein
MAQRKVTEKRHTRRASRKSNGPHVESVSRAFRLLEAYSIYPKPLSLSQLAAAAGFDKSAAQRLSNTLLQLGYLTKTAGGLVPGSKLLDRAYNYLRCNPLISRAYPILVALRRKSEERTSFSLFDDLTMVYAIRLDSKEDASYYAHLPGRRIPTYCTSAGRSVLAHLSEAAALDVIARSDRQPITPKTTLGKEESRAHIERARRAGYSLAQEEMLIGELAVAAAVLDANGAPIGAVSLAGSLSEWTPEKFERRFGPMVVEAAHAIGGT